MTTLDLLTSRGNRFRFSRWRETIQGETGRGESESCGPGSVDFEGQISKMAVFTNLFAVFAKRVGKEARIQRGVGKREGFSYEATSFFGFEILGGW